MATLELTRIEFDGAISAYLYRGRKLISGHTRGSRYALRWGYPDLGMVAFYTRREAIEWLDDWIAALTCDHCDAQLPDDPQDFRRRRASHACGACW